MQTLDIGEIAPLTTTWWTVTGAPANPTTITLTITKPDGTIITKVKADMVQGATVDVWLYNQVIDLPGVWRVQVVGTVDANTVTQPEQVFLAGVEDTTSGPCEPWCTWEEVEACGGAPTIDTPSRELAIDQASEILFNLSRRMYPGLCTVTRSLCFSCRSCWPTICSCQPYPSIDLAGRYPVWAAYDVTIDGVVLPQSAYQVRGRRWLHRTDGLVWPLGRSTVDIDYFHATWVHGRAVPVGGRIAAATFALQIAKLCAGDKTCTLPQRITQIQREGVSYTVLDSMKIIEEGRTGLPTVDMWLVSDAIGNSPKPNLYHPMLDTQSRTR